MALSVIDGLVLHLEADGGVVESGGLVSGWSDLSGFGNSLTAIGDPTIGDVLTPEGQDTISFDGDGDALERVVALAGLPSGSANRTMFLVVEYINFGGVSTGLVYGDGQKNQAFGLVSDWDGGDLAVQGWGGANDFDSGVDAASQGWMVQSVILDANTFTHYQNGVVIDSGSHVFNTDLQKLVLGAEIKGLGESQLNISAVLIYDRALTEAERQQVEAFLQNKYITGGVANDPPVAVDDAFVFTEDTALSGVNVLADNENGADSDPDLDPLSVALVSDVSNGALVLNPDGSFIYTPNADFDGQDSFVYRASDGKGGFDNATVALTAIPVDDLTEDHFVFS